MKRTLTVAAVIAGMAGLAGCGATFDDTETHSARAFAHSGATLVVKSSVGGLRFLPGTAGEVRVDRWLEGKAARDGNASWSFRGGVLRLSADCTMVFGTCGARYHVRVPPGTRLVVDGSDDGVILKNLDQDVDVSTRGPITAEGTSGRLRLLGGEEPIKGSGLKSADVRARTVSGSIALAFAVAPVKLDARSREGGVTVAVPREKYAITAESAEGSERSELKSARSDRTIVARSESGNIRIKGVG